MRQISDKDVTTLVRLLGELHDVVERLEAQGLKVPPEIQRRFTEFAAKNICLVCEQPLDGEVRRGCHQNCLKNVKDGVRNAKLTLQDAVNKGWFNPVERPPGRKGKRPNPLRLLGQSAVQISHEKGQKSGTKTGTRKS